MNPSNPNAEPQLRDLQAAARTLGQELVVFGASSEREIDSSFAMLAQQRQIGALLIAADRFLIGRQDQLVALAARYALPTIYPLRQYVAAGWTDELWRQPFRRISPNRHLRASCLGLEVEVEFNALYKGCALFHEVDKFLFPQLIRGGRAE